MHTQSQLDTWMRAKALSRWEGEGGALAPSPEEDLIDDASLHLLASLGVAVMESWDDIPPILQSQIVLRTRSIGAPGQHTRVLANLTRVIDRFQSES